MKESSTYQAILQEGLQKGQQEGRQEGLRMGLAEGAVVEARKLLRLLGERHFGPADFQTITALEGINDLARLEDLCTRLPAIGSWQELLELPAGRSRGGRRRRSP